MEGQDTSALAGIGVTGQMHTLIVLGEDGKAVRPAMMWNDTRTKIILPELKNKIRKFPEGEYLSKTISTGSPAANLYWMKKYEPENLEKIKKFLIGPDYLVFCLTGNTVTDYCEASTSCLYRIDKKEWSEEIRQLIGLEKNTYPEIKGSARKAGKILPEIAEEFQFSSDVEVIVGTGDNPATAISTGCLGLGYPVISLGTSGIFMMPIEKSESQTRGKKILFSFDDKKYSFLVQGAVQCNGNTFDWWNRDIMEMRNFHKMTTELDVSKMAENELMFYPHLNGEKTNLCRYRTERSIYRNQSFYYPGRPVLCSYRRSVYGISRTGRKNEIAYQGIWKCKSSRWRSEKPGMASNNGKCS